MTTISITSHRGAGYILLRRGPRHVYTGHRCGTKADEVRAGTFARVFDLCDSRRKIGRCADQERRKSEDIGQAKISHFESEVGEVEKVRTSFFPGDFIQSSPRSDFLFPSMLVPSCGLSMGIPLCKMCRRCLC